MEYQMRSIGKRDKTIKLKSEIINIEELTKGERADLIIDLANYHDIISFTMDGMGVTNSLLADHIRSESNIKVKLVRFVRVVRETKISDKLREVQEKQDKLITTLTNKTTYEDIRDISAQIKKGSIEIKLLKELLELEE